MKHKSKLTFILVLILIAFVLLASSHSTYSLKSLEPQVTIEKIYENAVNIDNMSNALNRLHKILEFFENNSHRINVDGLFGLRIAQGMLIIFLKKYNICYSMTLLFKKVFLLNCTNLKVSMV